MADRNKALHDTEDKDWWCQHGVKLERSFLTLCKEHLGLEAIENPAKAADAFAPDLIVNGALSDLKTQNTPFFTARRYGLDPRTTVTFNEKDYLRYKRLYPEIDIYFWVDWQQTAWKQESVEYLAGVYRLPFAEVAGFIEAGAKKHSYIHRRFDRGGNAKASYLLPLSAFEVLMQRP